MRIIEIDGYRISMTDKHDEDIDALLWTYHKCEQIHSDSIYIREDGENFAKQQADAIVTNTMHTKIAVRVADCSPIALIGKTYFAVVHAGRKGLKSWILDKTIDLLRTKWEEHLKMFVWPNIKSCCYEVGQEFREYFDAMHFRSRWNALHLDMISIIRDTALQHAILPEDIIIDPACTCCSDDYYSYRRGDRNQRMLLAVEKIF